MADLALSASEQRAILESPRSIMLLMYWHDYQQDCADSMGAECHGNRNRYEELKARGRAIVLKDPDIWDDEVLAAFGVKRAAGVPAGAAQSEDARDAARYRWLCERDHHEEPFIATGGSGPWGECGHSSFGGIKDLVDAAIDAAMSAASPSSDEVKHDHS